MYPTVTKSVTTKWTDLTVEMDFPTDTVITSLTFEGCNALMPVRGASDREKIGNYTYTVSIINIGSYPEDDTKSAIGIEVYKNDSRITYSEIMQNASRLFALVTKPVTIPLEISGVKIFTEAKSSSLVSSGRYNWNGAQWTEVDENNGFIRVSDRVSFSGGVRLMFPDVVFESGHTYKAVFKARSHTTNGGNEDIRMFMYRPGINGDNSNDHSTEVTPGNGKYNAYKTWTQLETASFTPTESGGTFRLDLQGYWNWGSFVSVSDFDIDDVAVYDLTADPEMTTNLITGTSQPFGIDDASSIQYAAELISDSRTTYTYQGSSVNWTVDRPHISSSKQITYSFGGGWIEGDNTFSVACNDACMVLVSHDRWSTYERLAAAANPDGSYSFTVKDATDATEILIVPLGDANGDGEFTNADVTKLKAASLGKTTLDDIAALACDVNGDGKITNADVTRAKAAFAGKVKLEW